MGLPALRAVYAAANPPAGWVVGARITVRERATPDEIGPGVAVGLAGQDLDDVGAAVVGGRRGEHARSLNRVTPAAHQWISLRLIAANHGCSALRGRAGKRHAEHDALAIRHPGA
jgi:hypothetical protein